jgi:hypothetical protein
MTLRLKLSPVIHAITVLAIGNESGCLRFYTAAGTNFTVDGSGAFAHFTSYQCDRSEFIVRLTAGRRKENRETVIHHDVYQERPEFWRDVSHLLPVGENKNLVVTVGDEHSFCDLIDWE